MQRILYRPKGREGEPFRVGYVSSRYMGMIHIVPWNGGYMYEKIYRESELEIVLWRNDVWTIYSGNLLG